MSIEFLGIPSPAMTEEVIRAVKEGILLATGCTPVRKTSTELGLCYGQCLVSAREDLTVSLTSRRVYVAFYVGSRDQREKILRAIASVLTEHQILCALEEE